MKQYSLLFILVLLLPGCTKEDPELFFSQYSQRDFNMGFTTWPFGPNAQDVTDTRAFLANNSDIYAEHIDASIPWDSWMNEKALPEEFTNDIDFRVSNKIPHLDLLVSISLLNSSRSDLATDYDGTVPSYASLNDPSIEDGYYKHVDYVVERLQPQYLVIAIEANELKLHSETKWEEYKVLITEVIGRIKQKYPLLKISESMTLHNLYQPDVSNPAEYVNDVVNYMNEMEFTSISFYPFFKQMHSKKDFQKAFDFLHDHVDRPIAFVETSHIAEDLEVSSFNLSINGSESEQNDYLETLVTNAQENSYMFIIWWAHRDFDALWEIFPDEVKDLGKLWRDTGLLDEEGNSRASKDTWSIVFEK